MAKRLGQIVAVLLAGIVVVGCSDEQASAPARRRLVQSRS